MLARHARREKKARTWGYKGRLTTVGLDGDTYLKDRSRFSDFSDVDLSALLDRCRTLDIGYPSSAANIWVRKWGFADRPVPSAIRRMFGRDVSGAWQAARTGTRGGDPCRMYDLRSAYAWSGASAPMPGRDRWALTTNWGADTLAYAVFTLPSTSFDSGRETTAYPYPYRPGRNVALITWADAIRYNADVREIIRGVRPYGEPVDLSGRIGWVFENFPETTAKIILRSYWGAWAAIHPIECAVLKRGGVEKTWTLPAVFGNPLWAHEIQARVKRRIWLESPDPLRVYVDSVVTTGILEESPVLGGWKLVKTYPKGIVSHGPGAVRDLATGTWDKRSGLPRVAL